jgi:hypothetical protein
MKNILFLIILALVSCQRTNHSINGGVTIAIHGTYSHVEMQKMLGYIPSCSICNAIVTIANNSSDTLHFNNSLMFENGDFFPSVSGLYYNGKHLNRKGATVPASAYIPVVIYPKSKKQFPRSSRLDRVGIQWEIYRYTTNADSLLHNIQISHTVDTKHKITMQPNMDTHQEWK